MMANSPFRDSQYYISRELSWLEFNQRVLDEARDALIHRLHDYAGY